MPQPAEPEAWWKAWIVPGVIVAVFGIFITLTSWRFDTINKLFDTLNAAVQKQAEKTDKIAGDISEIKVSLERLNGRLDLVDYKLDQIGKQVRADLSAPPKPPEPLPDQKQLETKPNDQQPPGKGSFDNMQQ